MKLRIANCMQAGHDDHSGVIDAVVEAVREARKQVATRGSVCDRMCARELDYRENRRVHGIDELVA